MLDDLHQHGGIQPGQPVVAEVSGTGKRQPLALAVGHLVEPEVAGGQLQRPGGHVDRGDVLDLGVGEQFPGERAGAAAEVADPARAVSRRTARMASRRWTASGVRGSLRLFIGDGVVQFLGSVSSASASRASADPVSLFWCDR